MEKTTLHETLELSDTLNFLFNLNAEERLTILECALRHINNLINDVMPYDWNLDVLSEDDLEKLQSKLNLFMNIYG